VVTGFKVTTFTLGGKMSEQRPVQLTLFGVSPNETPNVPSDDPLIDDESRCTGCDRVVEGQVCHHCRYDFDTKTRFWLRDFLLPLCFTET